MGCVPADRIANIVGSENLVVSLEERCCYSYDASRLQAIPECVAFPGNTREISEILQLANQMAFPVFPRGAGSGTVGASVPWSGGLVIAMNRLNRILDIDRDNMVATVQPAVITAHLQKSVAQFGLFYPPDPASLQFSTLGGNVAMGSGGPRAVKYGVTRDYVMGLEVVLPNGNVIHTGSRAMKSAVGYDLTRLMVGSEGTLGIFTEILLRLLPQPEAVRTMLAAFPIVDAAAQAVANIASNRIIPCTIELMDQFTVQVVENYLHAGLPRDAEAILLIEVDGQECVLGQELSKIHEICQESGATEIEIAHSEADRERLWRARRAISPALGQIRPGKINEDIAVPRTQIPALLKAIRAIAEKHQLLIVSFGHAGDGNIHTNIMLDPHDAHEFQRAELAVEELFSIVLKLGGTLSGEHGIGIAKSPFLQWEIGQEGWDVMWSIKQALDPRNILNPGKMFVADRSFFHRR